MLRLYKKVWQEGVGGVEWVGVGTSLDIFRKTPLCFRSGCANILMMKSSLEQKLALVRGTIFEQETDRKFGPAIDSCVDRFPGRGRTKYQREGVSVVCFRRKDLVQLEKEGVRGDIHKVSGWCVHRWEHLDSSLSTTTPVLIRAGYRIRSTLPLQAEDGHTEKVLKLHRRVEVGQEDSRLMSRSSL